MYAASTQLPLRCPCPMPSSRKFVLDAVLEPDVASDPDSSSPDILDFTLPTSVFSHTSLENSELSLRANHPVLLEIQIVSGREAILSHATSLEDLAGSSGQSGAMHGLAYFLDQEYAARKLPHLVCFVSSDMKVGCQRLIGSVLLFEYRAGSWKTGCISTGDSSGVRTVIGPESLRSYFAAAACSALLEHRARIVLVSFKQDPESGQSPLSTLRRPQLASHLWTSQTRDVQDRLALGSTFEETLSRLGKRTRTHLRSFRRRLEEEVPCDFFSDVAALIPADDCASLERLNHSSLKPLPQDIFNHQFRSTAQLSGGFVSGLRSKDGIWLALVGGWRQNDTTWIQWQMNSTGYEKLSLGTVLRSFFIEHEVARGTRWLAFHGGTSHSMHHAFPVEHVVDLVVRRSCLSSALIARVIPPLFRKFSSLAARGNFLADALSDRSLRWSSASLLVKTQSPARLSPQSSIASDLARAAQTESVHAESR